ncbi:hypothetical protein H0484_09720 [Pusillimonas sp. CC-YST705]|uniref:RDD family protein n=1 Tax=Mesopusillimonas faecipullorum TaxID=2755040 RepID=A0ABS8CDB4_9BURK|nr:hypothetical protein [Mesopusillimonas faecipullorum]MCB5364023.1 hypothetical protein [Mesopusillimonas faecipullorum]
MQTQRSQSRGKWPFPPSPQPRRQQTGRLTRGAMLADVVLVMVWGASIPGLMWLGAAGGF